MFWRSRKKLSGPLSAEERKSAEAVGVFLVNLHGDSPSGWPGAFLRIVAVTMTWDEARDNIVELCKNPELDDLRISGPHYLLELYDHGNISLEKVREFLESIGEGKSYKKLPLPLTEEEKKQSEGVQIYYIWYEDKFHYGGDRDSFPVMVCLSQDEAEAEMKKRSPVKSGGDGYLIVGPCSLSHEYRPGIVREVLLRIRKGKHGPLHIPSELW